MTGSQFAGPVDGGQCVTPYLSSALVLVVNIAIDR